jgi:hypothetical protein
LAAALIAAEDGIDKALSAIRENAKEITADKPVIPPLELEAPPKE